MPVCLDCSNITIRAETGRCRRCAAKHRHTVPAFRAMFAVAQKRGAANRKSDPAKLADLRANMLIARKKAATPESIAKANASRDKTIMGWCPPEYRALNEKLRRNGRKLDERKRMIDELIRKDEAARLAAMTPFERMMERARKHGIVEVVPMRRGGYDMSLTGCATGWL